MTSLRPLLAISIGIALLAGCSADHESVKPLAANAVKSSKHLAAGDISITPPGGRGAEISLNDALNQCDSKQAECPGDAMHATFLLANVSIKGVGNLKAPGKSKEFTPLAVDRLSYISVWPEDSCEMAGSANAQKRGAPSVALPTGPCVTVNFTDATTGEVYYTERTNDPEFMALRT